MTKFLVRVTYTAEGISGLGKEGGTARAEVINSLVENAGGRVECLYFAFGEHDLYVMGELPDIVTAAGIGIAVRSTGGVTAQVHVLITPEDMDAAARLPVAYQPPDR